MPPLSVWMVRLSLFALVLGALAGALLLGGLPPIQPHSAIIRQVHLDLMLFGWLVQFVLGVAYWILPRHAAGPERGPAAVAWGAFAVFQLGLAVALAGQIFQLSGVAPAGRVLVGVATLSFLGLLWGRAKPFAAR
jgi:hypothetical protein